MNKTKYQHWLDQPPAKRRSTARRLVETMLSGDDPFNLSLAQAAWIPVAIVIEAWTPERKREILRQANQLGYTSKEHEVIADYDLSLWHTDKLGFPAYVVGINTGQHNPLEFGVQVVKQLAGRALPLHAIKKILERWIHDYGSLVVGSVVSERNELYLRLVRHLFPDMSIEPYYGNDFRYGFKIGPKR